MEKYMDVMKQSVELSGTVLEGLHHIQNLFSQGKFEQTMFLFEDIVAAFSSIEEAVTPVKAELQNHEIDAKLQHVRDTLDVAVTAYESNQYGKVQEVNQFTLLPQCKKFKEELEQTFEPYILS